jgi:hypothetical protein
MQDVDVDALVLRHQQQLQHSTTQQLAQHGHTTAGGNQALHATALNIANSDMVRVA